MKGKFMTGILTLAVLLGLLLVPAMVGVPAAVAAEPPGGEATLRMPADVKVLPGETFDVDVTIYNPNSVCMTVATSAIRWNATMLSANDIAGSAWPAYPGGAKYIGANNLTYDGIADVSTPWLNTTVIHATVNFTAGSTEGVTLVYFADNAGLYSTVSSKIIDTNTAPALDWGSMQNMTLTIGTPTLTVDVVGSGDVSIEFVGTPGSYPNTTNQSWLVTPIELTALPDAGWALDSWSGDLTGNTNPDDVDIDSLAVSVTANFVELPPGLGVDPNSLEIAARYGNDEGNDTVQITNTGGQLLNWTVGSPPELCGGDYWVWANMYGNPLIPCNTVTMSVVDNVSSPDNYVLFANFSPPAQRVINVSIPIAPNYTLLNATMINATILVDKYSLDYVQQAANLLVEADPINFPGFYMPATASMTYNVFMGDAGWPYNLYDVWGYTVDVILNVPIAGNLTVHDPPNIVYAMVTGKETVATASAGNFSSWVINHAVDKADGPNTTMAVLGDLPNTTFMQTWWNDTARCFVQTGDGGTYNYPPMDLRSLAAYSVSCPAPIQPPAWASFAPTSGSLSTGASGTLTVTANSSSLNVSIYTGNFTISAPGSVLEETVGLTFEVLPATTIDVIRDLPADALDLDAEFPGDTFFVYVNFTASVDEFNSIGLTDLAPAGWEVSTDNSWCDPVASWNMSPYNKAEYAWSGEALGYDEGTTFSAKYQVTIPATANNGLNDWPLNDGDSAWAEYWFGATGPFTSNITGEWQKIVTVPGPVYGETRDVNADLLDTVFVELSEVAVLEDDDSSTMPGAAYENWADDTGYYWQEASKYCYFNLLTKPAGDGGSIPPAIGGRNPAYPDYIDLSTTALLFAGFNMDFEGDYGLVPRACTMSYAMESINHWLFVPIDGMAASHTEWQLSGWKAMESVHSWQFPTGCNT